MDPFAGLLDGPRARGAFALLTVITPPWVLRIPAESPITVPAVVRGHAWVLPDAGSPVRLERGDVAVTGHRITTPWRMTRPRRRGS